MSNLRNRICALEAAVANTSTVAPFLPVPRVRLAEGPVVSPSIGYGTGTASTNLTFVNYPQVVGINLTDDILDPDLDLRVELLRYKKKKAGVSAPARRGAGTYVHPTNYVFGGATPSGSDTHGGDHYNDAGTLVTFSRPSEWAITSRNQVVDIDNLGPWFALRPSIFRDIAGNAVPGVPVPCPSGSSATNGELGSRFMYHHIFAPQYFRFRYSIADINEGRGRITGPETPSLAVSSDIFPFQVDDAASAVNGAASGVIDPRFFLSPVDMRCWWQTRLPR